MASFDKYTNYNQNAGVSGVVFGSEKPVLEVEMNEMQEIQKTQLRRSIFGFLGNGISNKNTITLNGTTVQIQPCTFAVNGYTIENTGLSIDVGDTSVLNVVVYLEVWEDIVDCNAVLKTGGNQQSQTTVPNYIKDSRTQAETSRRKVLKYALTTDPDQSKNHIDIVNIYHNQIYEILCNEINHEKLSKLVGYDILNTTSNNIVGAINEHEADISGVNTKLGNSTLTTTNKTVTGAINELDSDMIGINTKVGSSTLNTTAKDLSGAVNEHETDVTNLNNKMGSSTLTTTNKTVTGAIVEHESDLVALNNKIGATSGIASLDSTGKVPASQLPSYVDDVIEGYFYNNAFYKESAHTNVIIGETGKIYVDLAVTPSDSYRYSGSAYVKINNVGDSKANIVSFAEASILANIDSTETHATLFGKIKKFFSMIGTTALTTTNKTVTGAINEHETDISGINSSVSDLKSAVGSDYIVGYTTPPSYSGKNITVYAGTKYICAEGRDANGNVKQVVRTLTSDVVTPISATEDVILFLRENLTLMVIANSRYGGGVQFVSDLPKIVPSTGTYIYYVVNEHCYYRTVGSTTANWYVETYCKIAYVRAEYSFIKYLKPNLQQNLAQKIGKDKLLMTMADVNDNTDKEFVPSAVAVKDISQVTTSGWNPLLKDYETFLWTTQTVSAPNFEVKTIDVLLGSIIDLSYYLSVGMKIRLVQGGVTKYFFIVKIAGNIITLYGGTDYVLTNAAITDIYYSMVKAPHGFPLNPDKWSVEFNNATRIGLANGKGYFPGISLVVPIGVWRVNYSYTVNVFGTGELGSTLSTMGDESVLYSKVMCYYNNMSAATTGAVILLTNEFTMSLDTKKTLSVYSSPYGGRDMPVAIDGVLSNTIIKATCAYL